MHGAYACADFFYHLVIFLSGHGIIGFKVFKKIAVFERLAVDHVVAIPVYDGNLHIVILSLQKNQLLLKAAYRYYADD